MNEVNAIYKFCQRPAPLCFLLNPISKHCTHRKKRNEEATNTQKTLHRRIYTIHLNFTVPVGESELFPFTLSVLFLISSFFIFILRSGLPAPILNYTVESSRYLVFLFAGKQRCLFYA